MDIDHQEMNDEGVGFEGNSTSVLQEGINASRQLGAPVEDQPLEHKIKIVVGESSSSGEKSKEPKQEIQIAKQKKRGKGTEAANTESCSDCVSEPEEANLHCPSCG